MTFCHPFSGGVYVPDREKNRVLYRIFQNFHVFGGPTYRWLRVGMRTLTFFSQTNDFSFGAEKIAFDRRILPESGRGIDRLDLKKRPVCFGRDVFFKGFSGGKLSFCQLIRLMSCHSVGFADFHERG